MRWPPVPPPARRTLTPTPAQRGTRNAERGTEGKGPFFDPRYADRRAHDLFRAPRSAFRLRLSSRRTVRAPPPPPHADQHPRRDERHEQARASVRDERQRDARRRQQRQAHADVQRGRHPNQRREPDREQLPEQIARRPRDPEAEPHERAEQDEDDHYPEEPPLLADRREDEIGVGVREVAQLLLPLPQPHAEQPPRADSHERLVHLPGRFGGRAARSQEGEHPGDPVLRARHRTEGERRAHDAEYEEVSDPGSRREERSEEHTSELQSRLHLVCRLLLEKKKNE